MRYLQWPASSSRQSHNPHSCPTDAQAVPADALRAPAPPQPPAAQPCTSSQLGPLPRAPAEGHHAHQVWSGAGDSGAAVLACALVYPGKRESSQSTDSARCLSFVCTIMLLVEWIRSQPTRLGQRVAEAGLLVTEARLRRFNRRLRLVEPCLRGRCCLRRRCRGSLQLSADPLHMNALCMLGRSLKNAGRCWVGVSLRLIVQQQAPPWTW